jgi:hypothetical protein
MILPAFFVTYPNDIRAERRIDETFDVQIITMVTECMYGSELGYENKLQIILHNVHKNWSSVNF